MVFQSAKEDLFSHARNSFQRPTSTASSARIGRTMSDRRMRIKSARYWSVILPAIVLLTSSSIFAQSKANVKNANRPNILVILADDLADWHLGCYGNREIRTPNIDRLAYEGVRMSNSFVHTPICSPSCASPAPVKLGSAICHLRILVSCARAAASGV